MENVVPGQASLLRGTEVPDCIERTAPGITLRPSKNLAKTIGSRGFRPVPGVRPAAARARSRERKQHPQNLGKPLENQQNPLYSKWQAPIDGFGGPAGTGNILLKNLENSIGKSTKSAMQQMAGADGRHRWTARSALQFAV